MADDAPVYLDAIDRAVYLLDRGRAERAKVQAFLKGRAILAQLAPEEVAERVANDRLTSLDGIGPSIASVVAAAVTGGPTDYLDKLDARSIIPLDEGVDLRRALRGDCHSHSTWSDGGAAVRAMAQAAVDLGHDYLVVTDHSERLTVAHGLSAERLAEQRMEIEALNVELAPFRLLCGLEVDIMEDGSLDLPDEVLATLDVVIASVHRAIHQPSAQMTRRLVTAVANPNVDILGHCSNRKIGARPRKPSQFDADYVFAACANFGTAVEINCRPERLDPPDDLLELALEWDCTVSINSDAHAPGQLEWINYGCDKAAVAGIEPEQVFNTRPAADLVSSGPND
ncbi:MAG: PHP domain-containing protein [Actinomycetota bacterium]